MFGKPESITASNANSSSMQISWLSPDIGGNAQPLTQYIVRWNPHSNDGSRGEKLATSNSTSIIGLTSNTQYNVTVAVRGTMGRRDGEISDVYDAITCKNFQAMLFNTAFLKADKNKIRKQKLKLMKNFCFKIILKRFDLNKTNKVW